MADPVRARLLMIALAGSWQSWLFEEQRQGRELKTFVDLETAIRAHDSRVALLKVPDASFRGGKAHAADTRQKKCRV
jgi:hypothetical protein